MDAIELQKKHFKEWGVMGEWENPYLTILPHYESNQLKIFYEMYKKKLIYQGVLPVHWSPSSRTALAEAELEYPENYASLSVFCGFSVKNVTKNEKENENFQKEIKKFIKDGKEVKLLIWTTTPWTLPANLGICVNPEFVYSLVELDSESSEKQYFIISKNRLEFISKLTGNTFYELMVCKGEELLNLQYEGLSRTLHNVYPAEYVSDESGTGLVHTAPGHGQEDFKLLTNKFGVQPYCPVDEDGRYTDALPDDLRPLLHGLEVLGDGNKKIVSLLKERNMLLHEYMYPHKYPHDWRTKKPIITRTTKQWFTDLRGLIPRAVDALDGVEMIPPSGRIRFKSILKQRTDWCLSRQRSWGVPIPVFLHNDSLEPFINQESVDHICQLVEKHGVDCWWTLSVEELLPEKYKSLANQYHRCFDTVDVWFDSGVSWYSVIATQNLPKSDIYLEGSDQHRGWFQSSLLTAMGATNDTPYKRIVTHGFVLDGNGRKMSKSEGNVIDPAIIIHGQPGKKGSKELPAYGSDVLRLWVGSVDYTRDALISHDQIATISDLKKKVRNTSRYLLGNIHDLPAPVEYAALQDIDKYLLAELHLLAKEITDAYEHFNFQKAVSAFLSFCSSDLSAFYFEAIKDRLYADRFDSLSRRAAQTVLCYALVIIMKAIAPILCHSSEEFFAHFPKQLKNHFFSASGSDDASEELFSIFQTGWFPDTSVWYSESILSHWEKIKKIKNAIHAESEKLRNLKEIKLSLEAQVQLEINKTSSLGQLLHSIGDLHLVFNVSEVKLVDNPSLSSSSPSSPSSSSDDEIYFNVTVSPATKGKCQRCWLFTCEENTHICSVCIFLKFIFYFFLFFNSVELLIFFL